MTGDRDGKVGVTMYCSSILVVEHGSLPVRFGGVFYHTRFRIDSKTSKTLPLTNPPMCAHQATPPTIPYVTVSEAAPLSTSISNQMSRETMAGTSTTRQKNMWGPVPRCGRSECRAWLPVVTSLETSVMSVSEHVAYLQSCTLCSRPP